MTNPDTHNCPICDEPFKPEDNCATDIELGTCHFDCLDGSPVVDIDTGEELPDQDMHSFPYSEVMDPPANPLMGWKKIPDEPPLELLKSINVDNQALVYENGRYYNAWLIFEPSEGGWFWTDDADSEPNPSHYRMLSEVAFDEAAEDGQ